MSIAFRRPIALSQIVNTRWFALTDLLLVSASGVIWMLRPEFGVWFVLMALVPWACRLICGKRPFKGTSFDWFVLLFLVTAWIGYWAAYDKTLAWSKVWLIVSSVLLFYAVGAQPAENFGWLCILLFCVGIGISLYFLLTHDFIGSPRRLEFVNVIGRSIMVIRPELGWSPIPPNYVAGIATITSPFVVYPAWIQKNRTNRLNRVFYGLILFGVCLVFCVVLMTTSRGILLAVASAVSVWVLWRVIEVMGIKSKRNKELVLPAIVLICLPVVIAFLYFGPAKSGYIFSGQYFYGTGSRAELLVRSLYLFLDFPFIGGGLGAFPGLYSHYVLGIPFFNIVNSHNLFLDVAIEQSILGGTAFLLLFLGSLWFTARGIVKSKSDEMRLFSWLTLFALIVAGVHGMVDDYLYNGSGTFLALLPAGMAMIVNQEKVSIISRKNYWLIGLAVIALVSFFIFNVKKIQSTWYSNLGIVQMTRVELAGFPTNHWNGSELLPALETGDASLRASLRLDPVNWSANYHLGLFYMLRRDFDVASYYLGRAHQKAPNHRGVIKSLGYCYTWSGQFQKARLLLDEIPESREELGVYTWWWGTQGRDDLARRASTMLSAMASASGLP